MATQTSHTLRATRAPAPTRSRLPSGNLRAPGRAYADDPKRTKAEVLGAPPFILERDDMACARGVDDDLFWPPTESDIHAGQIAEAKAICAVCPAIDDCLAWALENEAQGIWAGLLPSERRRLGGLAVRESRQRRPA
jgi:WhiB family transcriptional regulator, redox-sensing transcriptional regulator